MKLTLQRGTSKGGCTIGELFVDGVRECYTLEDTVREVAGQPVSNWKIAGMTAIAAGLYKLAISKSPRFGRLMIHLLGVIGFLGILMHAGNKPGDTEGCILVGQAIAPNGLSILRSVLALSALYSKVKAALDRGEEVWIEILNAPQSTT